MVQNYYLHILQISIFFLRRLKIERQNYLWSWEIIKENNEVMLGSNRLQEEKG